jgi:hypothetical protein
MKRLARLDANSWNTPRVPSLGNGTVADAAQSRPPPMRENIDNGQDAASRKTT